MVLDLTRSLRSSVRYEVEDLKIYIFHIYARRCVILTLKNSQVSLIKLGVDFPAFSSVKFRTICQTGGKYFILVGRLKKG